MTFLSCTRMQKSLLHLSATRQGKGGAKKPKKIVIYRGLKDWRSSLLESKRMEESSKALISRYNR